MDVMSHLHQSIVTNNHELWVFLVSKLAIIKVKTLKVLESQLYNPNRTNTAYNVFFLLPLLLNNLRDKNLYYYKSSSPSVFWADHKNLFLLSNSYWELWRDLELVNYLVGEKHIPNLNVVFVCLLNKGPLMKMA